MDDEPVDVNRAMMLDGNALAGLLQGIFGTEMTANPAECGNCGNVSAMGGLLAFTQAPGAVMRCPACEEVMLTIVETPSAIFLDARGAAYVKLVKPPSE
ncbi:MAG: DUF6510 family protein [Anaerolineales bacterium]